VYYTANPVLAKAGLSRIAGSPLSKQVCGAANSLEQLLVNYGAERVQQHFLERAFRADAYLAQQEEVPCQPVTFSDNQVGSGQRRMYLNTLPHGVVCYSREGDTPDDLVLHTKAVHQ
jgi:hypothetical protein